VTPRLVDGWEAIGFTLTPSECQLLARIDGEAPLEVLRERVDMPPSAIDATLARWISYGIVEDVGC